MHRPSSVIISTEVSMGPRWIRSHCKTLTHHKLNSLRREHCPPVLLIAASCPKTTIIGSHGIGRAQFRVCSSSPARE